MRISTRSQRAPKSPAPPARTLNLPQSFHRISVPADGGYGLFTPSDPSYTECGYLTSLSTATIFSNCDTVSADVPLPGSIEGEDLAGGTRRMQAKLDPPHRFDQVVVHEQLQSGADVQEPVGAGLLCQCIMGPRFKLAPPPAAPDRTGKKLFPATHLGKGP